MPAFNPRSKVCLFLPPFLPKKLLIDPCKKTWNTSTQAPCGPGVPEVTAFLVSLRSIPPNHEPPAAGSRNLVAFLLTGNTRGSFSSSWIHDGESEGTLCESMDYFSFFWLHGRFYAPLTTRRKHIALRAPADTKGADSSGNCAQTQFGHVAAVVVAPWGSFFVLYIYILIILYWFFPGCSTIYEKGPKQTDQLRKKMHVSCAASSTREYFILVHTSRALRHWFLITQCLQQQL